MMNQCRITPKENQVRETASQISLNNLDRDSGVILESSNSLQELFP